ncbi:uncharacterized protein EAE97_002209 [Botrytis byssoidea]|uniref:Uncharacterized protein n=1 Tax=Botrytis byssoidea TaxID=139641 RepID=A0A9P5LXH1_9HELO|nr:uncharacterized protein EAE97_002209 [Botrytis byssoidea]KAF7950657.1 hypothetical protein EAE97_002209 [Botrytis byssoidea]
MPLLDRLRHSFKARVKRRRQGLNESKIFGDGETSTGEVQERTRASCENARPSEARTSEYLSPYPYETLDDVNDDVDNVDNVDNSEEGCFTDFSSENSIVRFVSNSTSPGCSTALSPRPRPRSHGIQQKTTVSDQCVSDSKQSNDHVRLDGDSHTSAEDLEIFGYPLERVKARSSCPSIGWKTQDQIDLRMREGVEQSTPSSEPRNIHSEDNFAANTSTSMDILQPLLKLQEAQMPRRQRNHQRMMVSKPRYIPSEHLHRQIGYYNGVFFNSVSKNLQFKDNVGESDIKGFSE